MPRKTKTAMKRKTKKQLMVREIRMNLIEMGRPSIGRLSNNGPVDSSMGTGYPVIQRLPFNIDTHH